MKSLLLSFEEKCDLAESMQMTIQMLSEISWRDSSSCLDCYQISHVMISLAPEKVLPKHLLLCNVRWTRNATSIVSPRDLD